MLVCGLQDDAKKGYLILTVSECILSSDACSMQLEEQSARGRYSIFILHNLQSLFCISLHYY